jgi:hypothetical protein
VVISVDDDVIADLAEWIRILWSRTSRNELTEVAQVLVGH